MALSLENVTVTYDSFAAVRDVSLSIPDGEVFGLLGPSGSGKSTLLRAIAGLEHDVSGALSWDGTDLGDIPVHRRNFGLVFQDGQLFSHHDVAGNIEFGLRMHGFGRKERASRVGELLELLGLAGYQRRRVSELSGGEAQRVALARALAVRPRLLLLDEPLSGLDASLRAQLAVDLAEVLRESGITTMLVTHDQEEAFTLSDTVGVLDEGEIRQTGPMREVWFTPADEEVAEFLGVTGFLDATAQDGRVRCALGEVDFPSAPDGALRLGLRPTGLRVASSGASGSIRSMLRRKDHTRISVRPDGIEACVDAVAGVGSQIRVGEEVRLRLDPDGLAVVGPTGAAPRSAVLRFESGVGDGQADDHVAQCS